MCLWLYVPARPSDPFSMKAICHQIHAPNTSRHSPPSPQVQKEPVPRVPRSSHLFCTPHHSHFTPSRPFQSPSVPTRSRPSLPAPAKTGRAHHGPSQLGRTFPSGFTTPQESEPGVGTRARKESGTRARKELGRSRHSSSSSVLGWNTWEKEHVSPPAVTKGVGFSP